MIQVKLYTGERYGNDEYEYYTMSIESKEDFWDGLYGVASFGRTLGYIKVDSPKGVYSEVYLKAERIKEIWFEEERKDVTDLRETERK